MSKTATNQVELSAQIIGQAIKFFQLVRGRQRVASFVAPMFGVSRTVIWRMEKGEYSVKVASVVMFRDTLRAIDLSDKVERCTEVRTELLAKIKEYQSLYHH